MSNIEMRALKQMKNSTTATSDNSTNAIVSDSSDNSINNAVSDSAVDKVGCVIMASGLGKRFGGNKLMADLNGKPVIQWILDTTKDLFDYRVVVTRSEEVKRLCEDNRVQVILHSMPGRNDTVRLGLQEMVDKINYCFFTPADQPFISKVSLRRLINIANEDNKSIVRSSYCGRVGAPVGFPRWTFDELLKLSDKEGGSVVVKRYANVVKCAEVLDEFELDDIDTKEDLIKAQKYIENGEKL